MIVEKRRKLPIAAGILVLLNILVFIVVEWQMGRYGYSGLERSFILSVDSGTAAGPWHKIVTSMFLHAGFSHLINNILGIALFGYMLESEIGHIRLFVGYMFTGIVGNIVSVMVYAAAGEPATLLGASGAACGLIGMSLVYGLVCYARSEPTGFDSRSVMFSLFFTIYYGFTVSNVNNTAHIAGALSGVLYGLVFLTFPSKYYLSREGGKPWLNYLICVLAAVTVTASGLSVFIQRSPETAAEFGGYLREMEDGFDGWSMEKLLAGEYEGDYYQSADRLSCVRGTWKVEISGVNYVYAGSSEARKRGNAVYKYVPNGATVTVTNDTITVGENSWEFRFNKDGMRIIGLSEALDVGVVRNQTKAQASLRDGEYLIDLVKQD